jgi:hypothetical protein
MSCDINAPNVGTICIKEWGIYNSKIRNATGCMYVVDWIKYVISHDGY